MTYRALFILLAAGLLVTGCGDSGEQNSNNPDDGSLVDSLKSHTSGKSDGGTDLFEVEEQSDGAILGVFGESAVRIRDLMNAADPDFLKITSEEFEQDNATYRVLTLDKGDIACVSEIGGETMCALGSLDSASLSEDLSEATARGGLESGALGLQLLLEDSDADADTRGLSCSPSHQIVICTLSGSESDGSENEAIFPEVSIRSSDESGIELEFVGLHADMVMKKLSMPDYIKCNLGGPTGLYCHMKVARYSLPEDGFHGFTVHGTPDHPAVAELYNAVVADPDVLVTETSDGAILEAPDFLCETGLSGEYSCSFVEVARNVGRELRMVAQNDSYTFIRATERRAENIFEVMLASDSTQFSHGTAFLTAEVEDSEATEMLKCHRNMGGSAEEFCEFRVQAAEFNEEPALDGISTTFEGPLADKLYEALLKVDGAMVEDSMAIFEALRCDKSAEDGVSCKLLAF